MSQTLGDCKKLNDEDLLQGNGTTEPQAQVLSYRIFFTLRFRFFGRDIPNPFSRLFWIFSRLTLKLFWARCTPTRTFRP